MKHLGNIDLSGNYLKQGGLEPSSQWPSKPTVGMLHNYNSKVYLCINVDGDNAEYAPVTSTVSTYLHNQTLASDQWTVHHGLNYDMPAVVIYKDGEVIEPDTKEVIDSDTILLTFSMPVAGKAIVMCATDNLFNGGAANSGTGSLTNVAVLQQLSVADNVLKFGSNVIQYQLENGEVVAQLGIDADGNLTYAGQAVGKQLSNSDILAKFSVVNGVLFYDGAQVDNVGDTFSNADVLAKLTVVNGVLYYDGIKVDTVGASFSNSDVLSKLSVVNGVLYYDGIKVDTVGHTFDNQEVLDKLTADADGKLYYNGVAVGSSLSNADVLINISDTGGVLYYKGTMLGGSSANVTVSNTGTGNGLLSLVGNQINGKSLIAGTNVTINSTSDALTINASLSGATASATTFKLSDGYVDTNITASTSDSRLTVAELAVDSYTKLLMPFNTSAVAESISAANATLSGSSAITANASMRGGVALYCAGGTGYVQLTTAQATNANSAISGTGNFTIEFEILAGAQSGYGEVFGCYAGGGAAAADTFAVMASPSGTLYTYAVSGTTSQPSISASALDSTKHHVAIVRNSGTLYIYLDGVLKGSVAFTGSLNSNTSGWRIGNSGNGGNPFVGYIRNLAVYNYAKYTAAFTPLKYYPYVGATCTVDMTGKLLSSLYWSSITSMAVTSTETATSYLLWMLRTADGTVWYWDNTNKIFVADSAANILTKGVTTSVLTTAMSNYNWNYKSDSIGFLVAFVTTDGASTPILTSLTLNAIQSPAKLAGHVIVNSAGTSLSQRANMKFVGINVSDDATNNQTVITGITDSAGMTHNSQSMSTVLSDLVNYKGTVNGKTVDLTNLTDGSTLAYSQTSNTFKVAQPATGASGQGLYMTTQFTVAAGQEVTVSHQSISNGRAIYQADQYIAGTAGVITNHFAMSYDFTLSNLVSGQYAPYDSYAPIRMPYTYGGATKNTNINFPVSTCLGTSYIVDNTIYMLVGVTTSWATSTAIYTASVSAPTTWTLSSTSLPVSFNALNGMKVFKYNGYLYVFGCAPSANIYRASLDAPTVWTAVGVLPYATCMGAAFIVGTRVYIVAGQYNSAPTNRIMSADMSNLSSWTVESNTYPIAACRLCCYQYGNYLYIIGGETTMDSVYTNGIYRASVSAPTVWTQIGTFPTNISSVDDLVLYGGRVFVIGGRQAVGTYLSTVYHADMSNPVSWSTGTAMGAVRQFTTKLLVDDQLYVLGGFNGSTWSSSVEYFTLTATSTAGSGTVTLNTVNTALMQTISDVNVYAKIPANTTVQSAVSFDGGTTWSYYNPSTTGWVVATDKAAALAAGAALTLVSGYQYKVAGLTNFNVGSMQNIQVALLATSTAANTTPIIYYSTLNYVGIGTYGTLLIGSYGNGYADIGIKHPAGTYNTTNIKNNQTSAISMILKICDGTTTVIA